MSEQDQPEKGDQTRDEAHDVCSVDVVFFPD